MSYKKGHADTIAFSLFTKEATYNAGVTINDTNACSMKGFEAEQEWPDRVESDKDVVTGQEFGTDQELIEQRVKLTYRESQAKPNTVAGLVGLALGSVTSTKDGAFNAWRHRIVPIALGSNIPSIQAEVKQGGLQYAYKGVKCASFELGMEAGAPVSFSAELTGSGTRATSATAMPSAISESWILAKNCKVWMEDGSDITIAASPTQGTEDISSATPADLKIRMRSATFSYNGNLQEVPGFGGAGVLQELDYGRRSAELTFSLLYVDETEITHFINQNPLAIEFDCAGALIATGGSFKFGFQLVVPRFKLKVAPLPKGGPDELETAEFSCEIFNDGTNQPFIFDVFNAKSAYLA